MKNVYSYEEARNFGSDEIGNKSRNIIKLFNEGIRVPQGAIIPKFVFTSKELNFFELQKELDEKLLNLGDYFCIRSSSTNEDSGKVSYAGQYNTYCGIHRKDIGIYVKKVVESLNSLRAQHYQKENKTNKDEMSVLVQKLIPCKKSGILFTRNPMDNSKNQMVLESGYGLGELIVSGEIIPDNYLIEIETGIIKKTKGVLNSGIFFQKDGIKRESLEIKEDYCLDDSEIMEIISKGKTIEGIFNCPQDIEWGLTNQKLFIFQSRDITT